MTARQKCKKLKRQILREHAALETLFAIMDLREAQRGRLIQQVETYKQEISWYQELYDKARCAQIASAEEAEALRRENAQLRAELGRPRTLLQRLFG